MVPRCHKQALWKDRGRLFNHGIPEESQWDTHFVPLLLAHKFNCFTRTTRNLIQPPKTTWGSRWIYVCMCLWSAPCRRCGKEWVCGVTDESHNCYTLASLYLQTQRTIHSGKYLQETAPIQICPLCLMCRLYYSISLIVAFEQSLLDAHWYFFLSPLLHFLKSSLS